MLILVLSYPKWPELAYILPSIRYGACVHPRAPVMGLMGDAIRILELPKSEFRHPSSGPYHLSSDGREQDDTIGRNILPILR